MPKQFELMRAYAISHTMSGKSVSYADVAGIVNMSPATVQLALPFWADLGLMERVENGHIPSTAVLAFNRAFEWNPDTAPHKLKPVFRDAWFGKALLTRLSFRSMEEKDALELLADQVAASQDYRSQVKLLIDYLVAVGGVERDGNQLKPTKSEPPDPLNHKEERPPVREAPNPLPPGAPQNRVEFSVTISVDMTEMAEWDPARIGAFFSGMAQVLAAKGKD